MNSPKAHHDLEADDSDHIQLALLAGSLKQQLSLMLTLSAIHSLVPYACLDWSDLTYEL